MKTFLILLIILYSNSLFCQDASTKNAVSAVSLNVLTVGISDSNSKSQTQSVIANSSDTTKTGNLRDNRKRAISYGEEIDRQKKINTEGK